MANKTSHAQHVAFFSIGLAILTSLLSSCDTHLSRDDESSLGADDSSAVVAAATRYVYGERSFPPTFYPQPLKIIGNGKIPVTTKFKVNGQDIVIVQASDLTDEVLLRWQNPEPFMEVSEFDMETDGAVFLALKFKTVGKVYRLWMGQNCDGDWKVSKIDEWEI